jgi:hypothetical protein
MESIIGKAKTLDFVIILVGDFQISAKSFSFNGPTHGREWGRNIYTGLKNECCMLGSR